MSFRIKDGLTQGTRNIIDANKNFTGSSYSVRTAYSSITPTLNLDFTKGVLDPRIAFTRNSIGTYIGADGYVKTAAAGVPRFDCDPITYQAKGLLVEESRTNLLPNSSDVTTWESIGLLTEVVGATSPDGTGNAIAIADVDSTTKSLKRKTFTVADDSSTYCFSVYCKAGTTNACTLRPSVAGGTLVSGTGTFDLTTKTLTYTGAVTTGGYQELSNGWYRIWVFLTNNSTGNTTFDARIIPTANQYVTTEVGSVIVWGPQVEIGSFPTSYIPTSGTAVTRSADLAVITNLSWYNQNEGTILADYYRRVGATAACIWELNDGSTQNVMQHRYNTSGTAVGTNVSVAGSAQVTWAIWLPSVDKNKVAFAYKQNDFVRATNGSLEYDTLGNVPTVTQLGIGSKPNGTEQLSSCISKIAYYNKRLSNTELQNLTKG